MTKTTISAAVLVLAAILVWYLVARSPGTGVAPSGVPTSTTISGQEISNGGRGLQSNRSSLGDNTHLPASVRMSWKENMLQLLAEAPTAENAAARAYAVMMSAQFCNALDMAKGNGAMNLETDLPAKRRAYDQAAIERISQRCSDYKGVGKLRLSILSSLRSENEPMLAFLTVADSSPEAARAQLAKMLTSYDATTLQPLAPSWSLMNTDRIAANLPEELKPFAQGITSAAYDVAVCRSGAYCGAGSMQLDLICLKYAECAAADVEDAYRRLHASYGITFNETSRIADSIQQSIKRKDADALWPDTARWPETRK